jgi:HAD superfamily hydrolase (TIGR01509 family)
MTQTLPAPRWGALFDWDGVLVDSKALHQAAWDQVGREFGYPHGPDDFRRHFGSQNRRAIREILKWTSERLRAGAQIWMAGSVPFVELLAARGIPCAVVSSSPLENIDAVFGEGTLRGMFTAIVTAEDTRLSKPHPEGYLLGAARLGLPATRCVVFEDAPAGIEAGLAGGMRVVALTTTHAASELGQAHRVVDALSPELLTLIDGWFSA